MRFTEFQGIPNSAAPHEGPITVGAAAATLRSLITLHANTQFVNIKFETAAVRLTVNGTVPTTTLGKNYVADTEIIMSRQEADTAQLIRATGVSATLQAAQYIA